MYKIFVLLTSLFDGILQKSERRRWLFRKHSNNNIVAEAPVMPREQRHAIEVAAATAATAKAAVEMIRMGSNAKHEAGAARVIQTAFRGYLVVLSINDVLVPFGRVL